jgi:hypothetical protein
MTPRVDRSSRTTPTTSGKARFCYALLAVAALLAAAARLGATSVVLGSDAELADQAPVVLEATVLALLPPPLTPGLPATDYQLRVERVLKGRVAGGAIRLRVLGGPGPNGLVLKVWGAPALRAGERVLLFLVPPAAPPGGAVDASRASRSSPAAQAAQAADGAYRPLHLSVGVFHELQGAPDEGQAVPRWLAVRDLSEMSLVDGGGGSAAGTVQVRDSARFTQWLADRAAGQVREPDYELRLPASALGRVQEKFTYLVGTKQRWFAFDAGSAVHWTMSQAGQPGLDGGGFAEFQVAIDAWNANQGTNIQYRYDGTSSFSGGFSHSDGHNTLLTEDPNDDLPGSFACTAPGVGSGILAAGGTWIPRGAASPAPIQEADIVTQDGVGCWFNHDPARAQQVMAHELGHSLGLGHSCGDSLSGACDTTAKNDALMRTTAHNDDRGAAIADDDRAGILTLYPSGGGTGGGPPAAPSDLAAAAQSSSSIDLHWRDNGGNATAIDVESRAAGGSYRQIRSLPGGATTTVAGDLAAMTSYSFRVRAHNGAGFSAYSAEATATTATVAAPPAPANLTAMPDAKGEIVLGWRLEPGAVTAVRVEQSSPLGDFARIAQLPAGATGYAVSGLTAGMPYTFRVRAQNAGGMSPPSNLASAAAASGGPAACAAAADSLCLLGGRFQVTAHWRNAATGEHGSGQAIPSTDQTGMFWFFSATNVELIVKVIDGRALNGFFWTFYGGLSDVEYWVTVTDTRTGHAQTYLNPSGSICGAADVVSLPANDTAGKAEIRMAAPVASGHLATAERAAAAAQATTAAYDPAAAAACAGGPGDLCLLGGRFQVSVSWRNTQNGARGTGTAVALNGQTGLFWFFDAANVELVVKMVDGRAVNGKFWFFYGALSNVQYEVRLTDTADGSSRTYRNVAGNLCGVGDTSAF